MRGDIINCLGRWKNNMPTLQQRRRSFVNQEVAIKLQGRKASRSETAKVFREAWHEAKKKIK